jgi:hypothetical protein
LQKRLSETRAYVLTDGGVEVFDATEPPALPRLQGLFEVQDPRDIAITEDALFVASREGVHVVPVPPMERSDRRPADDLEEVVLAALEDGDAATVRRALGHSFDPSSAVFAVGSYQLSRFIASGVITDRELIASTEAPNQYVIPQMSERLQRYRLGKADSLPFELHEPLYLAIYYSAGPQGKRMTRAVRRLVLNGEDPNQLSRRESGRTPLAAAMLIADVPAVVAALLHPSDSPRAPRADPDQPFYLDVPDVSAFAEMTPLAALVRLNRPSWAFTHVVEMARSLLESGANPYATFVSWEYDGEYRTRTEQSIPEFIASFDADHKLAQVIRERLGL